MKEGDIWTIKLTSGEELVAKIIEIYDDHYMVDKPVSVAPTAQGMQLIPSVFTANTDDLIKINTSAITLMAKTSSDVRDSYVNATSKVKVPEKKIVLG